MGKKPGQGKGKTHRITGVGITTDTLTRPAVIELGIYTMVMDDDEAEIRHGVQPTYKKVEGFQPLQMTWGRVIVDAVFRGGKKHNNHGDTVEEMVRHVVRKIRKQYRTDVPIIFKMDSGFFDQKR